MEDDPAKLGFSRERKILNFQYQNWPTEEDIEFELIKSLKECLFFNTLSF